MEESRPLAAIDVGSNTIHLVIARPAPGARDLEYLADELELIRIGADVSATGVIGPERMARAIAVIRAQAERAHALGAATVLGIATEGIRAASNATAFIERVAAETGVRLQIISGEQEAALTYWGATSGANHADAQRAVVDLGGGSLEIVVGRGSAVLWRVSLPLGSGALHDQFTPSNPPGDAEVEAAGEFVMEALHSLMPPLPVMEGIACGGTATTLAGLSLRLSGPEEPGATRLRLLTRERMADALTLMRTLSASALAERFHFEEDRARILPAGTVALQRTAEWLGLDGLRVTGRGIREGAILAYAHKGDAWPELAQSGAGW